MSSRITNDEDYEVQANAFLDESYHIPARNTTLGGVPKRRFVPVTTTRRDRMKKAGTPVTTKMTVIPATVVVTQVESHRMTPMRRGDLESISSSTRLSNKEQLSPVSIQESDCRSISEYQLEPSPSRILTVNVMSGTNKTFQILAPDNLSQTQVLRNQHL
jgi:hypothetical protein